MDSQVYLPTVLIQKQDVVMFCGLAVMGPAITFGFGIMLMWGLRVEQWWAIIDRFLFCPYIFSNLHLLFWMGGGLLGKKYWQF